MLALASLVFAIVPMITYLWIVWLMDRYDREPIGLLALNFFWGAIGAIFFAVVFSILTSALLGTKEFLDAVFVAPVVEEPVKAVFLLWTVRDRRFDNITDGFVYGMAIGLGFGMTENFMYFLGAGTVGEWLLVVIIRTLFSAVMHAMATGTVGAFIGFTKFGSAASRWPLRGAGLAIAMTMHFVWNYSVSVNSAGMVGIGFLFILASVGVIVLVMQISLKHESTLIRRELEAEAAEGVLPATHVPFLVSTARRRMVGWLPPGVNQTRYVQIATKLAFRRSQAAQLADRHRAVYEAEIASLREEISRMLATS